MRSIIINYDFKTGNELPFYVAIKKAHDTKESFETNCLDFFSVTWLIHVGDDVVVKKENGDSISLRELLENTSTYTAKEIRLEHDTVKMLRAGSFNFKKGDLVEPKEYVCFEELPKPLSQENKDLVIDSLTKLLKEEEKLTDGTQYDVELIEKYFDLKGNGYNTPDESVSLLSEVTGDIANLLIYGMSEGMTHDRVLSVVPGNFKIYLNKD